MDNTISIDSIQLKNGDTISFKQGSINIFTGANNVGKSLLLKEIDNSLYSDNADLRKLVNRTSFTKNIDEESVRKKLLVNPANGYFYYRDKLISLPNKLPDFLKEPLLNEYLKPLFISYLDTETRLTAVKPTKNIGYDETAHNGLQELYKDSDKVVEISRLVYEAFGKHLNINYVCGENTDIRIGEKLELKEREQTTDKSYLDRLNLLPKLEEQGDGIKSFVGIILEIFINKKSIIIIDEPEAFLHPPQIRLLGKMILENKDSKTQVFISTHSEDFLKGILMSKKDEDDVNIFRIEREEDTNTITSLNNDNLKTIWGDPILKFSDILSGLFHNKVVVCESDSDCLFYRAILNAICEYENKPIPDILFTHCGGKQRLATVVGALKGLNVKTIAIADIDILNSQDTLSKLLKKFEYNFTGGDEKKLNTIESNLPNITLKIADVISLLNSRIEEIRTSPDNNFTSNHKKQIEEVIKIPSKWDSAKSNGFESFRGDANKAIKALAESCSQHGLFIVPVGELECFYKAVGGHGPKWVNEVLESVPDLATEEDLREARGFISKIMNF